MQENTLSINAHTHTHTHTHTHLHSALQALDGGGGLLAALKGPLHVALHLAIDFELQEEIMLVERVQPRRRDVKEELLQLHREGGLSQKVSLDGRPTDSSDNSQLVCILS